MDNTTGGISNKLQDAEPSPYPQLLSPSVLKSPGPIGMSSVGTLKSPSISQKAFAVQDKVNFFVLIFFSRSL